MDKNPPFWALYLLGAPRLENAGQIVEMDTRKALALLAYLALAGGQTRESLATLFWPEYDQASARGALRRTLSTLQKATLGDLLDISRERVQIRSSAPLRVDVQVFHQLLLDANNPATAGSPGQSQQILQQAVDLVHGDFLQGFTLRDSPTFDDWQYFQTDSLRRELGSALEKLALGYSQRTDDNEAIQAVRRWLALDELQEDAHRLLMKLYAWTGQRGAALRQYRECVRILEQELGVPPLPETTQLYEAILENQLPARPAAETPAIPEYPANPTPAEGYSLTGREAELGQLLNIYWTGAGNGAFVVVEGEAGIGKTRLAEEILGIAQRAGAATLTARCYEGETQLAYGPFLEGIPNLLNQPGSQSALVKIPVHWLREAVRLVPALNELRPDLPSPLPAEGPGAQSRFFEGIRQFLVGLLAGGQTGKLPGILLLDDLHWADPATLDLLIYLVRRLRGHSLMVLVTLRDRAGAEAARISSLLAETIRSGYGYVIPLARLSPEAVALLSEHSMQPLSEELRLRLYQETEGLPLLVLAYLDSMQPLDGTNWEMPASVRNIFHSRMPTPDSPGWQLLTTAAVIGRAFDFDTLRQASGRSEVETVSGLETLLALGLIHEKLESDHPSEIQYGFTHEKLLNLVHEEISLARLRLLHQRVAEALTTRLTRRGGEHLAARIAQHYQAAGQDSLAAEYYRQAGDYERQLFANQAALAHYQTALALLPNQPAALYEAIGDLQALSGDYSTAIQSYETAAALIPQSELPAIEHKLGNIHALLGSWELAECHYQAALDGSQNPAQQAWIFADWSRAASRQAAPERALELAQKSLGLARVSQEDRALIMAHNILGLLERKQGHLDTAARHLEHSQQLAEAAGDLSAQTAALNNLALIQAARADFPAAIHLANQALEICQRLGDRHRAAALHNNLADFFHAQGDQESAMLQLKQAAALFSEIGVDDQASRPEIWKLTEW